MPAHRVGGRVRIPASAVREMATPYGGSSATAPGAPGAPPPDGPAWLTSLQDPGRVAAVDARRAERAVALMDMVRAMATPSAAHANGPGLVREGRDEQDARWDERLG